MSSVHDAYNGSDADATRAVYARLQAAGPRGVIAMNLLRACKASERAKQYRGGIRGKGSYKSMAYDKKDWSIGQLVDALIAFGDAECIAWGWGFDPKAVNFEHVLYVELPDFGQVSFHHSSRRAGGGDHGKPWDGARGLSSSRIIRFATAVLGDPQPPETKGERDVRLKQDRPETGSTSGATRGPRRARGRGDAESAGGADEGKPSLPL